MAVKFRQVVIQLKKYLFLVLGLVLAGQLFAQKQQKKDSVSLPEHQVLFDEASKLIDSADYKEAIPLLKRAVKKKKDYWEAYNKMAYAKIKLPRIDDCLLLQCRGSKSSPRYWD